MSDMYKKLQEEMKNCMKTGQKERLGVVRMLMAEIKNAMVNTPGGRDKTWSDEDYAAIIGGYHKTLLKTLAEYPVEHQAKLKQEIGIVEDFMPKRLSADEVKALVAAELAATPERNFGILMKSVQAKVAGRADGKLVSETLKSCLAAT